MSRVFQALERTERLRGQGASDVLHAPQRDSRSGRLNPSATGEFERLARAIVQIRTSAPFITMEQAKEELDKSGAEIIGVVLNRTTSHAPSWLQHRLNLS